ncbi:MAG: PDZ domain-containing protein [Bilophila wadsworthia]
MAAEAELREGDIILSANLKPIKSVEEFSKIIREDAKKRGRAPAPASGEPSSARWL